MILPAILIAVGTPIVSLVRVQSREESIRKFAVCVDHQYHKLADQLIEAIPGSDGEIRAANKITEVANDCLQDQYRISFSIGLLRGNLSEFAYQRNPDLLDGLSRLPGSDQPLPDIDTINRSAANIPAGGRSEYISDKFRQAYARCVALSLPGEMVKLLGTPPASDEERAVMSGMRATLERCTPKGVRYHFYPEQLRPYMISAVYYAEASASKGA